MFQKIYFFLALTLCCQSAFSLESDFKQPIYFEAENSSFNYNQGIFSSSGGVRISQGTILIQAANAKGSLKNGQPYQITLSGNPVKFQQKVSEERGLTQGQANSILYDSTSSEITLKGNASIKQADGSSLSAETLRYNLTVGDIEAKGSSNSNKRVKIVIPPQKNIQVRPLQ